MTQNEYDTKLTELQKQVEGLQQVKIEPLKQDWRIDYGGDCYCFASTGDILSATGNGSSKQKTGVYRNTEELASIALANSSVRNRLEEMAMWLDPEYRVHEIPKVVYSVYTDEKGKYSVYANRLYRPIGAVYMSEDTAKRICELLNRGEWELDGI